MANVGFTEDFPVHIEIVDGPQGERVYARAYLRRDGVSLFPDGFQAYEKRDEKHFLVPGEFTLHLPAGSYELRLERGLEYHPLETRLEVRGELTRTLVLERWVDMNQAGSYSADLHVHRSPDDMEAILRAEDLNFAPTITTHVWGDDIRRPWNLPDEFIVQVAPTKLYTANSQEIERIQGGPGAIILMAPQLPLTFDGDEHYPPSSSFTRQVHEQGGYVEADKPFWLDTFVNVALGEIDFIELNCNHFYPRSVDTDLARWSAWPQEMGYIGGRGLALWLMNLYYRVLNAGFELPLSAGSANGVMPAPVGFNRVYVQLETFSYENFLAAMKAGRSFTTNGPILELVVDENHRPGSRISRARGEPLHIEATVRSKGTIETAELIVNGRIVKKVADGGSEIRIATELNLEESSWIALRAFEASQGEPQFFGHTSPVYVSVDGLPIRVPEDIRYLLNKVDRLIDYTKNVDGFAEESQRNETLELYRQAREIYLERLR